MAQLLKKSWEHGYNSLNELLIISSNWYSVDIITQIIDDGLLFRPRYWGKYWSSTNSNTWITDLLSAEQIRLVKFFKSFSKVDVRETILREVEPQVDTNCYLSLSANICKGRTSSGKLTVSTSSYIDTSVAASPYIWQQCSFHCINEWINAPQTHQ